MVQFKSFAILISLVTATLATTVANVESDISTISTSVTNLNNLIVSFTASSQFATAEQILASSAALVTTINGATSDVNNVTPQPVSESDAQTILSAIQVLEPNIVAALKNITPKRPLFAGITIVQNIVPSVHTELINLQTATDAFATALINESPTDLKATATSLKSQIDAAFTPAIAAYA